MSAAHQITPAPVRKTVMVKAGAQKAFDVFTSGMGRWWPASHSTSKSPLKDVVVEPRAGGRWFELGADGSETNWGKVLAWDPPSRVLLAWQLTKDWSYDPAFETEVEVTFTPRADGLTEVTLEHRNLERFGEAAETVRAAIDSPGGWGSIIAEFARVAEA
jgi:uncharacterized protein YndB with AHSA1/START domain